MHGKKANIETMIVAIIGIILVLIGLYLAFKGFFDKAAWNIIIGVAMIIIGGALIKIGTGGKG